LSQQISKLEKDIHNLKTLLPCCVDDLTGKVDKEKENYYWEQIREAQKQIHELRTKSVPTGTVVPPNYQKLRRFLKELPDKWTSYSRSLRNRFLKSLIDRVELVGYNELEVTIYWKAGFQQKLLIYKKSSRKLQERLWAPAEDNRLGTLFPSSSREDVLATLPERSWKSITLRAERLKISRKRRISTLSEPQTRMEGTCTHLQLGVGMNELPGDLNRYKPSNSGDLDKQGIQEKKCDNIEGSSDCKVQSLNFHQKLPSGRMRGISAVKESDLID